MSRRCETQALPDPRFATTYRIDYKGAPYYTHFTNDPRTARITLPSVIGEVWCRPGYQPTRLNKGYELTVNDYPFHSIQYGGSLWPNVVYTDLVSDN